MNKNLKELKKHTTDGYPFVIYDMHDLKAPFNGALHWHEEVEIIRIEEGTLYLTIGEKSYVGKAGDLYIINSKEIHSMYFDDLSTKYRAILFLPFSLTFLNMEKLNSEFILPIVDGRLRFRTTPERGENHKALMHILDRMTLLYREKETAYQLGMCSALLTLLYNLYKANETYIVSGDRAREKMRREILLYIDENYQHTLTLDSIAERFHVTPKYFSRYFKSLFNITLSDYINNLRLERAAALLTGTELSVTEIAIASGHSSCSYFNRKFRAAFGMTPGEYRNSHPMNN